MEKYRDRKNGWGIKDPRKGKKRSEEPNYERIELDLYDFYKDK